MPPRIRSLALAGTAAVLACVAGALCTVRVGHRDLGAAGDRLLDPGWHLRVPLSPVATFPREGTLLIPMTDLRSREGARFSGELAVDYLADPASLEARAPELAREGLESVVGPLKAELQKVLGDRSAAEIREDSLPADVEAYLRQQLTAAGLVPKRIRLVVPSSTDQPETKSRRAGGDAQAAEPVQSLEAVSTDVRLLLVGLDGADWAMAGPLMAAGELPVLASLVRRGRRAVLESYDPMMSPLLWTTVVTGVGPDRHGVADFLSYPATGSRRMPITSDFRRVPALWNLAGRAGLRSGFVGWWASFPAEDVSGYMISNLVPFRGPRARGAGVAYPPGYLDEMADQLVLPSGVPAEVLAQVLEASPGEIAAGRQAADASPPEDPPEEGEDPVAFTLRALAQGLNTLALGEDLLRRDLDLVGVYFEGIDLMGHRFQHCLPPRLELCPDDAWRRFQDVVPAFYRLQDRWLGRLLETAGPDWTLLVLSDHGFRTGARRPARVRPFTTGQPVEWHRKEGIFVAAGPGIARGELEPVSLFDMAPTVLALLGLPVAEDLQGRVLVEALDPGFLVQHPVASVPSYGPRQARAAAGGPGPDAAEAREELLRMLQGLGYVGDEAPSADGQAAGEQAGAGGEGRPTVTYHRNLATYHLNRGEFAEAEASLRQALALKPLPKTYQLLAETLVQLDRPRQAVAALEEGIEAFPDLALENVLWAVEILVGRGDGAEARALLARHAGAAGRKPGLEEACRGLLAEAAGQRQEAVSLYLASLEADPSRTMAARHLLPLLADRGEAGRLEPLLRQAVQIEPRGDEGWGLLGAVLGLEGRGQEAVEALQQAVALAPDNPQWLRNLAVALGSVGQHQQAAGLFLELTRLAPQDTAAWLGLGTARRLAGDAPGAVQAFRRARDLDPAGADPALGLAVALAQAGEGEAARRTVSEALRRHPDHPGLRRLAKELGGGREAGS